MNVIDFILLEIYFNHYILIIMYTVLNNSYIWVHVETNFRRFLINIAEIMTHWPE